MEESLFCNSNDNEAVDWEDYRKRETELWKNIREILMKEGWKPMSGDMDGQYLTIFTTDGCIVRRWVEQDSEYSEWHGRDFVYYNLWTKDVNNMTFKKYDDRYDFLDDTTLPFCAHTKRITRSKAVLEASKLIYDFYKLGEY